MAVDTLTGDQQTFSFSKNHSNGYWDREEFLGLNDYELCVPETQWE